jgi:diacylglycerol kinase family enzyme
MPQPSPRSAPTAVRAAVVINPAKVADPAGRRAEIVAALVEAGWGEPLWLETTPEDPGTGQARAALAAGAQTVFACGGDGTVMACVTALAGSDTALAVIPSGTGNLLAANLGLPSDAAEGIRMATDAPARRIDVGCCGQTRFAVMGGMGFDADMVGGTPEQLKARIGWPAYALTALRHLRDRPMRVRVRLDGGHSLRVRARTVLVANVGKLAGGLNLLPDAVPDDGLLDVAIIAPGTIRDWLALAWGVLRRRPRPDLMRVYRARKVELLADTEQPRQLDGDVIAPGREMTLWVEPSALLVHAPRNPDDQVLRASSAAPVKEDR